MNLKKDIIEFLMSNDCLYTSKRLTGGLLLKRSKRLTRSKRLAGFKDVARKEELWTTQAEKIKKISRIEDVVHKYENHAGSFKEKDEEEWQW